MFKHLTRLAAANQIRAAPAVCNQARSLLMRNSKGLMYQQRLAAFSASAQGQKRDLKNLIPDYQISEVATSDLRRISMTQQEVMKQHPLEYAAKKARATLDYTSQIARNEFLIFNLPRSVTNEQVIELCSVKGVQIQKTAITKAADGESNAYAFVQVADPSQVKLVRDRLRNYWIEDKKLKLKGREELTQEGFDQRTIIVQNIPMHLTQARLIDIFSPYGAVVGVELPTKNVAIEEEIQNKLDSFVTERKERQELDLKRAQKVVQDSVIENEQYFRNVLQDHYSPEELDQVLLQMAGVFKKFETANEGASFNDVLESQRQLSISSMLTQLQSESAEVTKARKILQSLKDTAEEQAVPSISMGKAAEKAFESELQANSDVIRNAITYVNQNRQAIDEVTLGSLNETLTQKVQGASSVDPIQTMLSLSRSELAYAYDALIQCLEHREKEIESRIKSQINYLGKDERILFEHKDWKRENEDMKEFGDPFNHETKAEGILSITEQVNNVMQYKNMSPEQRLYELVARTYNPFLEANFNENQLAFASASDMDSDTRIPVEMPSPDKAPTVNRLLFNGYQYTDDNLEVIQQQISDLKDKFDMPFDELYHKEKKLVDAVIKATQALKLKEAALADPMGADRTFSLSELKKDYYGPEYQGEHQYLRDQRKRSEKLLNEQIDSAGTAEFNFAVNDTKSKVQEMLDSGVISKKEYDEILQLQNSAQEVNLGYAFLTYSHADEAKLALVVAQGLYLDGMEAELTVKNESVDHGDFDLRYQMNRRRNEAKLSKELKDVRETRQALRKFEQTIEQDLPSLKKLKQFREVARDVIDNKPNKAIGSLIGRTREEEETLNDKIRQLQKENPNIDYTQLFETERAELARKAQHKKAFASYKAFQFLKHGVEMQARGGVTAAKPEEKRPAPYQTKDPYDFTGVQDTVNILMKTKERFPRVLDAGDPLDQKPGRKFGYTHDDFLLAYFGKDYARNAALEFNADNNVYGFNDFYKKKYPIDKYLQGPALRAQQQLVEDRTDIHAIDSETQNKGFLNLMTSLDTNKIEQNAFVDKQHPTDKGRSLIKDTQQRLESYFARKEKQTGHEMWNSAEVAGIRKSLREEYFPKPVKKVAEEGEEGDTKAEEKFEPFYEGEGKEPAQEASTPSDPIVEEAPAQQASQSKRQGRQGGGRDGRREGGRHHQKKAQDDTPKSPFYAGQEQTQFDVDQGPIPEDVRELNREFLYDYKYRHQPKTQEELEGQRESVKTQRLEDFAKQNGAKPEDIMSQLKDWANIADQNKSFADRFSNRDKFGQATEKEKHLKTRPTQASQSLSDFAGTDADLSEREEEDIYSHYMEQMRRAKQDSAKETLSTERLSANEKLAKEKITELEGMFPDMPRFEGFFASQAEGKHPFEGKQFQGHPEGPQGEDLAAEEAYDEELLQRELEGRLIGETLSPRQFGVLYKAKIEQGQQIKFLKNQKREHFLDNRDMVRLMEEQREAARRRKILNGEWTEEQSHEQLLEAIQAGMKNAPELKDDFQFQRDFKELKNFFWQLQGNKKLYEKEYVFDEGLGESLKDHVESIKKNFPGLEVLVRRDRDGYPVVKTQYKPKYKYDIDKITSFDPEGELTMIKESLDDILKTIIGGDSINSLDKKQLESKLMMIMQKKDGKGSRFELDEASQEAVSQLYQERVQGKYKTDREGFAKAFLQLSESVTYDETKPITAQSVYQDNETASPKAVFKQMTEERELMTYELAEQMAARIKEHLFLKERKASDFVKPRRSETSLFAGQTTSQDRAISILQKDLDSRKAEEEGFDKAAYQELKAEIRRRREAKEQLLQQGFPELKPYINI